MTWICTTNALFGGCWYGDVFSKEMLVGSLQCQRFLSLPPEGSLDDSRLDDSNFFHRHFIAWPNNKTDNILMLKEATDKMVSLKLRQDAICWNLEDCPESLLLNDHMICTSIKYALDVGSQSHLGRDRMFRFDGDNPASINPRMFVLRWAIFICTSRSCLDCSERWMINDQIVIHSVHAYYV